MASMIFPRLVTGFSDTDGIGSPSKWKQYFSSTLPYFGTRDLHLASLNVILANVASLSRPLRTQRHLGTDVAVTVTSSIKARIGSWRMPDLDRGPLHSTSTALTSIVKANSVIDMVQPVMMPFSRCCHADVIAPEVNLMLKLL